MSEQVAQIFSGADRLRSITTKLSRMVSPTSADICAWLVLIVYLALLTNSLGQYLFSRDWSTDDALQQSFMFHDVFHPGRFAGDLITETMTGYLAPLHYWLSYYTTAFVGDVVLAGHWVMMFQLLATCSFIFLAVRDRAALVPALFAVLWFLHTRPIFQRITGGLPRGWAAPVLAAYLYFVLKRDHRGVLATLLVGCLLHPPATFLAGVAYGLFLLSELVGKDIDQRKVALKQLKRLALAAPIYAAVTLYVLHRPAEIGGMVSYQEAAALPEFQYPNGRFPFVPLRPIWEEIRFYGYQPFLHRLYNPGKEIRWLAPFFVVGLYLAIAVAGFFRRRKTLPSELVTFLLAIVGVYLASRALAFKLYVPNRHLQIPMGMFLILSSSIGIWLALCRQGVEPRDTTLRRAWPALLGIVALGGVVWIGTGSGLRGDANFNQFRTKRGGVMEWIRTNTPEDALIAGHPTHIDPVMLFGERRAFATTETAHPFYQGYFKEMSRRITLSFRAHYATSLRDIALLLLPEGVDYFVFERKKFYPEALKKEEYFSPINSLVTSLTSHPAEQYAYKAIPKELGPDHPYLVYRDDQSVVIDVKALARSYNIYASLRTKQW